MILYWIVSYFYLIIFITSAFVFSSRTSYLYIIVVLELLRLEVIVIILFYRRVVFSTGDFLIIMTLVTSEAALGLTLIFTALRVNGRDILINKNTVYG